MLAPSSVTHARKPSSRFAYVLDDEPEVAACVCHGLVANGFVARQFCEPIPFLEELKTDSPALIVLDLALGQSDAVEMLRHLKEQNYSGKVLLISGRDETTLVETKQIGERYGLAMLPVLRKPFRASDLKSRLSAVLEDDGATRVTVNVEKALRNDAVALWYQSKVDLRSGLICGAEVLLRVRHSEHGIVSPIDFLSPSDPVNEQLFRFAIGRAMADWGSFAAAQVPLKLTLALPLSVMRTPDFVRVVRELLPKDRCFPGLIISVSGHELIRDSEWAHEIATQLKLYNVRISVKSLRSDRTLLTRLFSLPCNELRLDCGFSVNCSSTPLKRVMCQTMIDLAHRFGISVCAEDTENTQDLRALIELGCDTAQGALFGEPMDPSKFVVLLRSRAAMSTLIPMAKVPGGKPRLIRTV